MEPAGVTPAAARLAGLAREVFDAIPAAEPFLADWPPLVVTRAAAPATLPVLHWMLQAAACAAPATASLVAALGAAAADLVWRQSYAAADFGPAFLARYGWTEFLGTLGPVASHRLACGVLMLGPHTIYPSHAHLAEELYVPLAGTALWQSGKDAPAPVAPGVPVHHPPWLPHAMQTGDDPLVALYVWRGGDLGAKPLILRQDR